MKRLQKNIVNNKHSLPRISLLALAIAGIAAPVQAANFELSDFRLQVDSSITLGSGGCKTGTMTILLPAHWRLRA
jgi:hypothetical protein